MNVRATIILFAVTNVHLVIARERSHTFMPDHWMNVRHANDVIVARTFM